MSPDTYLQANIIAVAIVGKVLNNLYSKTQSTDNEILQKIFL
jgi:hypothetical protein